MKKKRKLKKKIIVLIILIIVLILCITGLLLYKTVLKQDKHTNKVINSIPEYGYTLEQDQPKIYKKLFEKLAKVLKEEPVKEEKYAELISQMVAIDFYNLDNKVSKNDIGGTQFIYEKNKDNFSLEASETVYKYIENNIYKNRKQTLPKVTNSSVIELKEEPYKYKNITDDKSYIIKVKLEYKEDLDYPTEVVIKLLHSGKKLEVYSME